MSERRLTWRCCLRIKRALIAVDLGAESCRVSLLRWVNGRPAITLVHRFANAPREVDGGLHWDLGMIEAGLDEGFGECAAIAIGRHSVDCGGWVGGGLCAPGCGRAGAGDPFCYRDERTVRRSGRCIEEIAPERMRELTGVQLLRINTLYQLYADALHGHAEEASRG